MTDAPTPTNGGEGNQPNTPASNANGNEPSKNGNDGGQNNGIPDFDPSKLSDEQINKVLEDQRLWKTQRLAELREQAKKGKEYESEKAKLAEAEAIKKGEFDKVLKEKEARIQELETKLQTGQLDNVLRGELQKAGVKNIEAALRLVDRANLKIGENGKIEGMESALEALKSIAPELLTSSGSGMPGTNPTNPSDGAVFKLSDINNPEFYAKNHKEIKKALAVGRVDMNA